MSIFDEFDDYSYISDGDSSNASVDFDHDGSRDIEHQVGPAVKAPQNVRDLEVTGLSIEWLNLNDGDKNHMVAVAKLRQPFVVLTTQYLAVRISMELNDKRVVSDMAGSCGIDHCYGTYMAHILKYADESYSSVHERTYEVKEGLKVTIGEMIDLVINQNMHKFVFLSNSNSSRWKGCGCHLMYCFAEFVHAKLISPESREDPTTPLHEEMMITYDNSRNGTSVRVGKGHFLQYKEIETSDIPQAMFSEPYEFPP